MVESIQPKSNEALGPFKKGGSALLRDDLDPEFYEMKGRPKFERGVVYRVFGFDIEHERVFIGPSDAPQEDIDDFSVLNWTLGTKESYKEVSDFALEELSAFH